MIAPLSKLSHLGKSRADEKREQQAQNTREWQLCCKVVDARDQRRCRICGWRGNPHAIDLLDRIHRHHVQARARGGPHIPANIASVCPAHHDEIHTKGTLRLEGDADMRDHDGRLCGLAVWYLDNDVWAIGAWV